MSKKAIQVRSFFFRAEIVTATAAEVISANTPVAYAPACASTSARKRIVTMKQMPVNIRTSGLVAFAQLGAIPYLGRYRGTMFKSPAMAEAPANQRIEIV